MNKLKLVTETRESSIWGGWTAEARLEWEDEHGKVWILRTGEHGEEILGIRIMDAEIAGRVREILGSTKPRTAHYKGWGIDSVEGALGRDFTGDVQAVKELVKLAPTIARSQYAAGLRAEADRVDQGYPNDKSTWQKQGFDSARAFCLRKISPETRIQWD